MQLWKGTNLEDIAPKLAGSRYFSTLDASGGFFQIPLDDDSFFLTTFIRTFGKYRFRGCQWVYLQVQKFSKQKRKKSLGIWRNVSLQWWYYHLWKDWRTWEKAKESIWQNWEVRTTGKMCTEKERGEMFWPHYQQSRHQTQWWMNRSNFETEGTWKCVRIENIFRYVQLPASVAKKNNAYYWAQNNKPLSSRSRTWFQMTSTVAYYEVKKPTNVSADAGSYSFGAVLLLEGHSRLIPTAFMSRSFSQWHWKRNAQIEKECLTTVWACEKFSK